MAFQAPKLTNAGKALYYDNMAGAQITITTIKMGSGTLAGPIANLTDLVEPVVVVDALATVRDNYVDVSGTFSNADLDQGFYWREIGVFAANPDDPENREADILYCYQNAYDTADYIPVASVETVEKNIVVPIIVGDAAAVSCTLDHSLVLATLKDLEDHENDKNAHPGLTHYDPIGSAEKAVLEHDKDDTSHEDIRTALSNKVPIVNHGDTNVSLLDHSLSDGLHVCSNWADCPPGLTDSQGTCLVITYLHYEDLGQYWGRRIYFPTNNKTVYINNCEVSKWNGWEPIATDVPPQEFELSLINGWNAATFRYSKMQNGLVIINATDITKGSGETGVGMFVIGTIPEGFRPPEAIFSVVNNYTTGAMVTVSELIILPSGEIQLHRTDNTAYKHATSVTFVAAN